MIEPPRPPAIMCGIAAFHGLPDPGEVDLDHGVPFGAGEFPRRFGRAEDPGVGDRDVEASEGGDRVGDGVEEVLVADVDVERRPHGGGGASTRRTVSFRSAAVGIA